MCTHELGLATAKHALSGLHTRACAALACSAQQWASRCGATADLCCAFLCRCRKCLCSLGQLLLLLLQLRPEGFKLRLSLRQQEPHRTKLLSERTCWSPQLAAAWSLKQSASRYMGCTCIRLRLSIVGLCTAGLTCPSASSRCSNCASREARAARCSSRAAASRATLPRAACMDNMGSKHAPRVCTANQPGASDTIYATDQQDMCCTT